ncbi:UDP-glycosyltransferase 73C3-like [Triticum urartu]|uniref:UDP-glycosyltransferase 73C3-like n=1 Tax=Triticum urartu TaxID=4572 RepID=UPI002044703F|nr:UDP-glycosyltransferase 73C3-like [Triticum urartu]
MVQNRRSFIHEFMTDVSACAAITGCYMYTTVTIALLPTDCGVFKVPLPLPRPILAMIFPRSGDGWSSSTMAHFLPVSLLAQGHTIPMTDMVRLLPEHGAQVSSITTPVNASSLAGFAADVKAAGLAIQLVELWFPTAEFGLSDGCENLDMIHATDLLSKFMKAIDALREPLMAHLREQQRLR